MTTTDATHPLDWFVSSLLQSTGQLMLIVDHMARHPSTAPAAESVDDVLHRLLRDTLADALDAHEPAALAAAAALLADAREVIGEEIFLVDPEELTDGSCGARPNRAARRRRRPTP